MDSWELDDGTLSLTTPLSVLVDRKPYTTSEDKKGHDVFLGAKFPKVFQRWVSELKERPGSPYQTNADVVRDAIYLGLQILSLRAKQSTVWNIQAAITQQEARIFQHTRIYRDVEAVVEQLEILSRNGDEKQALSDLVEYVHLFAAHPEGNKYASVLKEKLLASRRLKGLLEQLEEELGEELG
jgi:hypothetical protein